MSFWVGRRVFVTGTTGLLGGWLTEELLAQGAEVTVLLRDWIADSRSVSAGFLSRCNIVRGELEDLAVVTRAINEFEIDSVFHLGAQAIVGTAVRSPLSTFESNIKGTWTLLEAVRQCPKLVERVVVASSDKAYGDNATLPYTEDMPLQGRFPYDVSKSCSDLIALSYFHTWRLPIAVTRCGNLFGGGDLNFNRLIPGTIRSVLRDEAPIIRSDGTLIRDYVYVRDAVEAYLLLAQALPREDVSGEPFNFGPQQPLSVLEVVDQVLTALGRQDLQPVVLGEAPHEIPTQYLDCTKASRTLGWRPKFTFEDGLVETVAWYRDFLAR